jgi:hypothetical protein
MNATNRRCLFGEVADMEQPSRGYVRLTITTPAAPKNLKKIEHPTRLLILKAPGERLGCAQGPFRSARGDILGARGARTVLQGAFSGALVFAARGLELAEKQEDFSRNPLSGQMFRKSMEVSVHCSLACVVLCTDDHFGV